MRVRFILLVLCCGLVCGWLAVALSARLGAGPGLPSRGLIAFLLIAGVAMVRLNDAYPFRALGYANWVTTFRAGLVALVGALLWEQPSPAIAWAGVLVAAVAASLDGLDGWLARRTGLQSRFGARFDMEIDALLILLLAVFVWRYGKAGGWVVLSGALRYGFIAAGWLWPWMQVPLPESIRRKFVCVVQIVALIVAIGPVIPVALSALAAAGSLALLVWSFAIDVRWLASRGPQVQRV